MDRSKRDTYMRYVLEKDAEKRAEHLEHLHNKAPKTVKGAWVDKPMSAKRRAVPITGRVDPGTLDATKKRDTRIFTLNKMAIQEVVNRILEKK